MYVPAPGAPDDVATTTFGALPAIAARTSVSRDSSMSTSEIELTVAPRRRRSRVSP